MTTTTDRELRMTRRFEATPERVFAAWTKPELVSKWLFAGPPVPIPGVPVTEAYDANLDVRVGGKWTITARREGVDYTATGEYLELNPPHRLVFTFAMLQFSPNSDRIIVDLAPDGAGTMMTFTQQGVDIAAELAQLDGETGGSEQGWEWMFMGLEAAIAS